jgi:hypothetical protein
MFTKESMVMTRALGSDFVSFLLEALLGRSTQALAGCELRETCTYCGVGCGVEKRKYREYCWECNTCTSGCAWCPKSCVCSWC